MSDQLTKTQQRVIDRIESSDYEVTEVRKFDSFVSVNFELLRGGNGLTDERHMIFIGKRGRIEWASVDCLCNIWSEDRKEADRLTASLARFNIGLGNIHFNESLAG